MPGQFTHEGDVVEFPPTWNEMFPTGISATVVFEMDVVDSRGEATQKAERIDPLK
jgi:hypothetical protein